MDWDYRSRSFIRRAYTWEHDYLVIGKRADGRPTHVAANYYCLCAARTDTHRKVTETQARQWWAWCYNRWYESSFNGEDDWTPAMIQYFNHYGWEFLGSTWALYDAQLLAEEHQLAIKWLPTAQSMRP